MSIWYAILNALGLPMFEMDFMKNALLAVLLMAPLFGLLSTMIVTGRMSFFSDALGHSGFTGIANRIAKQLEEMVGVEARAVVPGHVQRGGSPSAYDRMLSTVFGVHAAQLIAAENYGQAVAMVGNTVSHNPLSEVAGKTKFVPADAQAVRAARSMGISLGD